MQAEETADEPAGELGRGWAGPAALLGGMAALVRIHILEELAATSGGVPRSWAAWAVLGDWEAQLIQAGILAAAATVVIWGVTGARRILGILLAALLLFSAASGWPVENMLEPGPLGVFAPWKFALFIALGVGAVTTLALVSERALGFRALLSSPLFVGVCAMVGIGGTGWSFWRAASEAPMMEVRTLVTVPYSSHPVWSQEGEDVEWDVPIQAPSPLTLRFRPWIRFEGDTNKDAAPNFKVLVDGEVRFEQSASALQSVARGEPSPGLEVRPGQSVTFQVEHETHAGSPAITGFADVRLETVIRKPRTRASREQPNLVLITIDGLRSDRLSCYNYERWTSPNLDRLAERGLLFEAAFSTSSWSWPSTASLLTGAAPYQHGFLSDEGRSLVPTQQTLGEALQSVGYSTAAISASPMISRSYLLDQGFERVDDAMFQRNGEDVLAAVRSTLPRLAPARFFLYLHLTDLAAGQEPLPGQLERLGLERPADFPTELHGTPGLNARHHYERLLDKGAGQDAGGDPHPEKVIPPLHRQWILDRYDGRVATVDFYVGQVLDALERLQLLDKTVISITGSHGEELLDHGSLSHGHALWRELVQVPMILAGPGIPERRRNETEISNRHLAPTLAHLGGARLPQIQDSLDLLTPGFESPGVFYQTSRGTWPGGSFLEPGDSFWELELMALRDNGFTVHGMGTDAGWGTPTGDGIFLRVFSIPNDPDERTDLAPAAEYLKIGREHQRAMRGLVIEQQARRETGVRAR